MFCKNCGNKLEDESSFCSYCGHPVNDNSTNTNINTQNEQDTPKTGMGVLLGLFLGIIGLIIGICLYKEGTVARKTFLKSWGITFGVGIAVQIIIFVLVSVFVGPLLADYIPVV